MKPRLSVAMGIFKVIMSLVWMFLGVVGIVYGVRGVRWAGSSINQAIEELQVNIEGVTNLLVEAVDVFEMVDQSLATVESSTIDAAIAIGGTTPVIGKTSQIVIEDVPQALEDVQASMPSVIQAATAMEQTLYLLSKFQFTIPMLIGDDIQVGLGVDYNPEVPLDEALTNLNGNLVGIPDRMRAIEGDLTKTEDSILAIGDNMLDMARDVDYIREQMRDITPELTRLIDQFISIQTSLKASQTQLPGKMQVTERIIISVLTLMILSQIPNIYFAIQDFD